jgi:hypothetical protein
MLQMTDCRHRAPSEEDERPLIAGIGLQSGEGQLERLVAVVTGGWTEVVELRGEAAASAGSAALCLELEVHARVLVDLRP